MLTKYQLYFIFTIFYEKTFILLLSEAAISFSLLFVFVYVQLQRIINNTQGNQILLRSEVENLQISNEIDENNAFNFTFNIRTSKYNAIGPFDFQNELNQIHQMLSFNHSLIINNTIEIYCEYYDLE